MCVPVSEINPPLATTALVLALAYEIVYIYIYININVLIYIQCSSVHTRVRADNHFVHTRHHRIDGTVGDENGLNACLGECECGLLAHVSAPISQSVNV
mgnify:CR=1 FL=1